MFIPKLTPTLKEDTVLKTAIKKKKLEYVLSLGSTPIKESMKKIKIKREIKQKLRSNKNENIDET
jgi:hypothetical protein